MTDAWLREAQASYDADAEGYAAQVSGLLGEHPHLTASLALFADLVSRAGDGPVADVGCGPGHVTDHLHGLGVEAFGLDLSPEMVALARRDHPHLRFEVGTMTALDLADDSLGGLLAFWSTIHLPDEAVPGAFAEFARVLHPGAPVLVGFHVGDGVRRTREGYSGRPIDVRSVRRRPAQVSAWLRDAGLVVDSELVIRPDDEVPGAIVIAHRPA